MKCGCSVHFFPHFCKPESRYEYHEVFQRVSWIRDNENRLCIFFLRKSIFRAKLRDNLHHISNSILTFTFNNNNNNNNNKTKKKKKKKKKKYKNIYLPSAAIAKGK